jgi:hypothetical protein
MMHKWRGAFYTLAGFETRNREDSSEMHLNFILSNGTRSTQRDRYKPTKYDHMIPRDAIPKIHRVTIYYYEYRNCIVGFSFFDKDGALLWEIGRTYSRLEKGTVLLAENEVIVGVVAKHTSYSQSVYTDFQFQIATR